MLHLQVIRLCKICVPTLTVVFGEYSVSQVKQQSQSLASKSMQ